MKFSVHLAVLSILFFSEATHARVIYGEDNRKEISEGTEFEQTLARSAVSMVSINEMTTDPTKPGLVQFSQKTLKDWLESQGEEESEKHKSLFSKEVRAKADQGISFCETERFINQPNPAMCSGFLIAEDLIVTAGHCAEIPNFCEEFRWVFDFKVDPLTKKAGVDMKVENIYKCEKVVSNLLSMPLGLDYAVVKLDRKVLDREPIEIQNNAKVQDNAPLIVIGSPSGLPLKIAGGANVRNNTHPNYFSANTDTFQGNSGSGIFNALTGVVEGILVRGEDDFVASEVKMCIEAKKCKNSECRGEDISRMTSIPEVGIQVALNKAAKSGDMVVLERLLKLNLWVDFHTKDGQSALIKAVQGGKLDSTEALINRGADVNLQDKEGNAPLHHLGKNLNTKIQPVMAILLKNKANLELKNKEGKTPLLMAAESQNLLGVKLLIASGANKNAQDKDGENVLFKFARKGNRLAVKELIALGVSSSAKNNNGQSALDLLGPEREVAQN